MALTFKFDPEQLERLIASINNLSDNLAKWEARQATAIEQGFANLVSVLGDEDVQQRIDEITNSVKSVKDKLQTSVDSQKGD